MSLQLVDTATLAAQLAVSQDWVRDHAAELGGIRIGDSPRGPLRFDPRRVERALDRRRLAADQPAERRRPGPAPNTSTGIELLPLPEEA